MDNLEVLTRLLIATCLGALIGFERERSKKFAGLRTHALVALGACLLTLLSTQSPTLSANSNYDPSRIISNIIVGIGFIGGGAILRSGYKVMGITTAATLWMVAAIGIAAGIGSYEMALMAAAIVYFVLVIFWKLEKKLRTNNSELILETTIAENKIANEE